ncbi:hypothetical protein M8818_000820 [Zalaria obscura]|uniref:Uncharacterized protein n=1 Tax=Zalaria obscura TaxID=2024903 RepID=A0ACC3SMC6_9PEZI
MFNDRIHVLFGPDAPKASLPTTVIRLSPQLHTQVNHGVTADCEDNNDSRISPTIVIVLQLQIVQVVTSPGVLADPASARRLRVDEVGPGAVALEVLGQVRGAGLAIRRIEDSELRLGALDLDVEAGEDKKGAHEVVEGVEVIQPIPPEGSDLRVRDEDTAEGGEGTDNERVYERGEGGVWRVGCDELSDTGVHELVEQHDEEDGAGLVAVVGEPDRPVEWDEVQYRADDEVRDFRDDEAGHEGDPGVHL